MAEPICCNTPMVHNSFTEQYECADTYFALHDDDIDPVFADADDLNEEQRSYLDHWLTSRVDDILPGFIQVGDVFRPVVIVELAGVSR